MGCPLFAVVAKLHSQWGRDAAEGSGWHLPGRQWVPKEADPMVGGALHPKAWRAEVVGPHG